MKGVKAIGTEWIAAVALATHFLASAAFAEAPLPPIAEGSEASEFDWIQTTSGEWLKGEFDRLHDEKVYFDSDEFDDVTVDWSDVESLIPVNPVTLRLSNRKIITGVLKMRKDNIRVDTASGVVEVSRNEIVGIITGSGEELGYWSGSFSVGLSARAGNTSQTDLNLRGDLRRQTSMTRFKVGYVGQISSADKVTTANSHRIPLSFDIFLTDRLFLTTPSFEYVTDEIQNIGSRVSLGAALGYELVDNSMVLWDVGAGAAYVYTSFDSVLTGDSTANDAAVVASTSVNLDLPRGVEWDNSYRVQIVTTDLDKTNHHAESILSFDIWGPLELDLTFIFDRVEKPEAKADAEIPKSNDYRLTMGLGIDF